MSWALIPFKNTAPAPLHPGNGTTTLRVEWIRRWECFRLPTNMAHPSGQVSEIKLQRFSVANVVTLFFGLFVSVWIARRHPRLPCLRHIPRVEPVIEGLPLLAANALFARFMRYDRPQLASHRAGQNAPGLSHPKSLHRTQPVKKQVEEYRRFVSSSSPGSRGPRQPARPEHVIRPSESCASLLQNRSFAIQPVKTISGSERHEASRAERLRPPRGGLRARPSRTVPLPVASNHRWLSRARETQTLQSAPATAKRRSQWPIGGKSRHEGPAR